MHMTLKPNSNNDVRNLFRQFNQTPNFQVVEQFENLGDFEHQSQQLINACVEQNLILKKSSRVNFQPINDAFVQYLFYEGIRDPLFDFFIVNCMLLKQQKRLKNEFDIERLRDCLITLARKKPERLLIQINATYFPINMTHT